MDELIEFEEEIIEELNTLYGVEQFKETIINYIEYIHLREQGRIGNLGNYNLFITVPQYYNYTDKIIDLICKILRYNNVIKSNYYELSAKDLKQNVEVKEDLIVIGADILNTPYSIDSLQRYIHNNQNKVYIVFNSIDRGVYRGRVEPQDYMIDEFSFYAEITKDLTIVEKQKYILDMLDKHNIKVAEDTYFIRVLTKKNIMIIDKELLYVTIKSKATNTNIITNEFLESINRTAYINKERPSNQPIKSAMQELEEMIGLEDVKAQIKQIVNYVRVNKNRGQLPMLHMAFMGNPGCAKTSIARLIGRIYQEEKILKKGTFTEVSRSDLVGKYIGHTESQTRDIIESARGGVLFIDEAYCLATKDSTKDFGHQAISTLIKYMEDYREDLCVILAGYTEDMQELIKANKGFESRINFKVQFNNYTADELYQIFKSMAKKEKYKLDSKVKSELIKHFEIALKQENFSNGRYVRNIYERAKFEQADRVSENKKADKDTIKLSDIRAVIERLEQQHPKEKQKIGFYSAG